MRARRQHIRSPFVLAMLLLTLGMSGAADSEDPVERITAKADRLELDQRTGVQTLSGNVVISQGDISIYGESIQVAMRNGAISRIYGAGTPVKFSQRLSNGDIVQTESDEIDYLTSSWTLVFRGNVRLQRGDWQLGGQVVEYNIRNRNFQARGGRQIESGESASAPRVSITYNR